MAFRGCGAFRDKAGQATGKGRFQVARVGRWNRPPPAAEAVVRQRPLEEMRPVSMPMMNVRIVRMLVR